MADIAVGFASTQEPAEKATGVALPPLQRQLSANEICRRFVQVICRRTSGTVEILLRGPATDVPTTIAEFRARGSEFWSLAIARELDDLVLHLRSNEPELGTWILRSEAGACAMSKYDQFLCEHDDDWFAREVVLYWKRLLKRIDVTSRSLFALVEPHSCFQGSLLELVLAVDQSFMLAGSLNETAVDEACVELTDLNFGALPTLTGLS